MTRRTEVRRDYHDNGKLARTVERVEFDNGIVDIHEAFFSPSEVRYDCLVYPADSEYARMRLSTW